LGVQDATEDISFVDDVSFRLLRYRGAEHYMKDPVGLPVALIQLSDFWKPFSKETGDAPLHFPVFFRHHYGEIGLSRGLQRIAMSPSCLVEKDLRPLLFCPFSEALEGGDPLSPQVVHPFPAFPAQICCFSGLNAAFHSLSRPHASALFPPLHSPLRLVSSFLLNGQLFRPTQGQNSRPFS
jgi:hypothetical protein